MKKIILILSALLFIQVYAQDVSAEEYNKQFTESRRLTENLDLVMPNDTLMRRPKKPSFMEKYGYYTLSIIFILGVGTGYIVRRKRK